LPFFGVSLLKTFGAMQEENTNMKKSKPLRSILKFLSWTLFSVIALAGLLIALVFICEDEVKSAALTKINKHLKAEVRIDPKDIDLTFISTFPKCAIEFRNLTAMEAWTRKTKDTLLFAKLLSLQFNIKDLLNKNYSITKIELNDARTYLKVDKKGQANYLLWETSGDTNSKSELQFKLQLIAVKNFLIVYKNLQQDVHSHFTIQKLSFAGNFSENKYQLSSLGKLFVKNLSIANVNYINNKHLNLDVALNVNGQHFEIQKSELALNEMGFDIKGAFVFEKAIHDLSLNFKARHLDIASILSLLPEKHKSRISDYRSSGEFFAGGSIQYKLKDHVRLNAEFGINNATIEYAPLNTKLNDVMVAGVLKLDGNQSSLDLTNVRATLKNDHFSGKFLLNNFNDPHIDVAAVGTIDLQNILAFWPIDTLEQLQGHLRFNGRVKGMVSDLRKNTFSDKLSINLDVKVENLLAKFKNDGKQVNIATCNILAHERNIRVEDFKMNKGSSDIFLSGEIPGMFNYILNNKAPLIIKGILRSDNFSLEDFVFVSSEENNSASRPDFYVPSNVRLVLDADIKHFNLGKFHADNIRGAFELKNQKAMISDMSFETMEGKAEVEVFADCSGSNPELALQAKLMGLNVKTIFTQLNNFGQTTLLDKHIKGYVTAAINFTGSWDKKLRPNMNSIVSSAEIDIEQGELSDFKPLSSLSKFVDIKELQNIKFAALHCHLDIKNSTIYIPKTSIKNSVLNLDFAGTHKINNDIDYHIHLLISELLAKKRKQNDDEFGIVENDPDNRRGAFILMTGNLDNIVFKYDRKGLKQKIKEDIRQEKQSLKNILREEFGSLKRENDKTKPSAKAGSKDDFEKTGSFPRKKEEDDDF
jgi:hypothetical protein